MTDQQVATGVGLAQRQRDVDEHDQVADRDCSHVRPTLPRQFVLNRPLQGTRKRTKKKKKFKLKKKLYLKTTPKK